MVDVSDLCLIAFISFLDKAWGEQVKVYHCTAVPYLEDYPNLGVFIYTLNFDMSLSS